MTHDFLIFSILSSVKFLPTIETGELITDFKSVVVLSCFSYIKPRDLMELNKRIVVLKNSFMITSKGRIFNIQRFSVNDGPGIRTTVFFKGCPLSCKWCHNPECFYGSSNLSQEHTSLQTSEYSITEILEIIKKDLIFYEESGGGVTFSGGEPMLQKDFLAEVLKSCRIMDIPTVVDTSGYAPFKDFREIAEYTNLFLFDLKLMNEIEHIRYTGVSNELILENLRQLSDLHRNIIIRIPLIPEITDTAENIDKILDFISTLKNIRKINLLPYNELCRNKYIRLEQEYKLGILQSQSDEFLNNLSKKFSNHGYEVKIRG